MIVSANNPESPSADTEGDRRVVSTVPSALQAL
jgi:hypothetical protein